MRTAILSEAYGLFVVAGTEHPGVPHRVELREHGVTIIRVTIDVLFTGDVIVNIPLASANVTGRNLIMDSEEEAVKFAATLIAMEILHD